MADDSNLLPPPNGRKPKKTDTRQGDKAFPAHGETSKNRETQLTLELIDKICGAASLGTSEKSTAAAVAGVNIHTFRYWLKQGQKNPDSIHGVLLKRLAEAIGGTEIRVLDSVKNFLYGKPAVWQEVTENVITTKANGDVIKEERKRLVCVQPAIEPSEKTIQWFLRNRFGDNWGDIIGLNQNKEEFTGGHDEESKHTPASLKEVNEEILNIAAQVVKITGTMDDI